MRGLGFTKYVAQGGDIGSFISLGLAERHDACVGKSLYPLTGKDPS